MVCRKLLFHCSVAQRCHSHSLLIGPPGAGKTTTLRCLQAIGNKSDSFTLTAHNDPQRATRGIDIQSLSHSGGSDISDEASLEAPLEVCVMDFGGHIHYRCLQESMLDLGSYFAVLVLSAFGMGITTYLLELSYMYASHR